MVQYEFDVRPDAVPARPDKLFVPEQLEQAVDEHTPDDVSVNVNTQFRRTVVRATTKPGSLKTAELEVSWEHFEDEEHYEGRGWEVVMSAVKWALDQDPHH